ncbi:hypothetical protein NDN08_001313 [Rhodosorus marinus]|uniref:Uncharacterized protein n=1 Tax=Rhodosorus marinus TaxID=101924 RepID=A0AAV8UT88_9RHOD|nr:hypothetical protein NDN08_001313 [Rhodosorus marinus]
MRKRDIEINNEFDSFSLIKKKLDVASMEFLKDCRLDVRPDIHWWYRGEVISPAIEVRLLDSMGSVLKCEESLEIRVTLSLADDLMETMSLNSKGQRALFGTRTKRMTDFTVKFDDLALNVDMGEDHLEGLMFVAAASGDFSGVYVSPHPFVSATLAAPPLSCPICSNPKEAHPTARDCICDDCTKVLLTPLCSPYEAMGSAPTASKATKDQRVGSADSTATPLYLEPEDLRQSKAIEAARERRPSEGIAGTGAGEHSGRPTKPSKERGETSKRPRRESSAAGSPSTGRTCDAQASRKPKLELETARNTTLFKKGSRSTQDISSDRCAEEVTSQERRQIKGAVQEKRVVEGNPAPRIQAHGDSLETMSTEECLGQGESRVTTRNQARMQEKESPFSQSLAASSSAHTLSEREIFASLTWPAFSQEHSQLALMKTLCRPVDEMIRDLRSITNPVGAPQDGTRRD